MLNPPLTNLDYLQSVLQRAGVTPERSAGQNFLISSEVIEAILVAVTPEPKKITELGAGAGPLTQALIPQGYTVRAIERNTLLSGILRKHIPSKLRTQLNLETQDLRTADWTWDEPYQLVGNIPYNLSGFILRRITQLDPAPTNVVLLVQQEVGQRLSAQPPEMQLLSLAIQLWGTADHLLTVPPSCFWPAPQVTSSLVLLRPHANPDPNREAILAVAKPFFQQRRKQLGGMLARLQSVDPTILLAPLGIQPTQRPQELTVAQWQALAAALDTTPK